MNFLTIFIIKKNLFKLKTWCNMFDLFTISNYKKNIPIVVFYKGYKLQFVIDYH